MGHDSLAERRGEQAQGLVADGDAHVSMDMSMSAELMVWSQARVADPRAMRGQPSRPRPDRRPEAASLFALAVHRQV